MKVLQINTVCDSGSIGRISRDLADELKAEGHECLMAYGRGGSPKEYDTFKFDTKKDIYIHGLRTRITDQEGFGSKKATKKLIVKLENYNPDIIHLHNLHGYYINLEILFQYLKESNKPVVWTLHDCWAFTGHCTHFDFISCDKWKEQCFNCPEKGRYPKSFFLDNSKNNYKKKKAIFTSLENLKIITPSHWLKGKVEESFLKKYPVKVIHNGIDLEVFKPTMSNFREKYDCVNKKIVLGVANIWDQRKGFDTFTELSKGLDENYQIVLVGLSKKQLKNLPENIIGIERTDSVKELVEIYTAADVFVNPTLEDNFPTVNLEAQACGTPVITFDSGGSKEGVDNTASFVIDDENRNNFEKEVQKVCNTSKNNFTISDWCKKFAKRDVFKCYIDIYKKSK